MSGKRTKVVGLRFYLVPVWSRQVRSWSGHQNGLLRYPYARVSCDARSRSRHHSRRCAACLRATTDVHSVAHDHWRDTPPRGAGTVLTGTHGPRASVIRPSGPSHSASPCRLTPCGSPPGVPAGGVGPCCPPSPGSVCPVAAVRRSGGAVGGSWRAVPGSPVGPSPRGLNPPVSE